MINAPKEFLSLILHRLAGSNFFEGLVQYKIIFHGMEGDSVVQGKAFFDDIVIEYNYQGVIKS